MTAVVVDQAVAQRLLREGLQPGVHRGAHGQPFGANHVWAIGGRELAIGFGAEIAGFIGRSGVGAELQVKVRHDFGERFGFFGLQIAVLGHLAQDIGAPVHAAGELFLVVRLVVRRSFNHCGQIGCFRNGQVGHCLVEVGQRGFGQPVSPQAEENLVEIELKDVVLGQVAFELPGDKGLADLALDRIAVAGDEVLGDLLGDGRSPGKATAINHPLDIAQHDLAEGDKIDPAVAEEVLVLGRNEGLDHVLGHLFDRDEQPSFFGELSH